MRPETFVLDVAAYSLQVGLLLLVGLAMPRLLGLRAPRAELRLAQALLLTLVLWPLAGALAAGRGGAVPAARPLDTGVVEAVVSSTGGLLGPSWAHLLLGALAAGAVARVAWLALGLRSLGRIRDGAVPLAPEPPGVTAARRLTGVGDEVPLLVSPSVSSPVTYGWRRPVVVVPRAFAALADEAQEGIACHELLHVARRDWSAVLLEEGIRSVLWFHPAVAALSARLALVREQAVDAEVVARTGKRKAYLRALCAMARERLEPVASPVLPFHRPGHLLRRVSLIAQEAEMSRTRLSATLSLLAVALLSAGTLAVSLFPYTARAVAGDAVLNVGGDVKEPQVVKQIQPVYPEEARKARLMGAVVIEAVVDTSGHVVDPKVVKSPGDVLSRAALEAVRQWTYRPATKNGKPVKARFTLTLMFRLA